MTYKEIINMINNYEKEYQTARYINGEHGSNYSKTKMLKDSYNNYLAALVALFDFTALSKSGILKSYKEAEKHIFSINDSIAEKIEKMINVSDGETDEKSMELKDELNRILNYENVYSNIFYQLLYLKDDKIAKIYKYSDKKRKFLLENEERIKKTEDDWFVVNIYEKIKKHYAEYNLALQEHVNRIGHGGKDFSEFIDRRINSVIKYTLLVQAIKDSNDARDNNISVKKDVIDGYYKRYFETYVKDQKYQDSEELYMTYKDTFKKAYYLSEKPRIKLNKKISKLNGKKS